jgi:hypothetical protein
MPILRKWLLLSMIALVAGLPATAQEGGSSPVSPGPSLSAEEMKTAIALDSLTVPTPGEFFSAIDKAGKPNWSSQYRPPVAVDLTSRAQLALSLGTLIADGYIAVEAQDGQQVKNVGKDVLTLARKLSVSERVLARGNSITQFAQSNSWDQLNEELEATQNEVKNALEENRDSDLIILLSIGGWIRGTEVVTGLLLKEYKPETAKLLRQPALVAYLQRKLKQLPEKLQRDPLVQTVDRDLDQIERLVSFAADHVPSPEEIKTLNDAAGQLTQQIAAIQ